MHFQDIAFALFASGAFAAPAALKIARDSCSDACYSAYNTCRGAPDANMSSCASEFASCLGYTPFDDNGSLVTPTACSSSAAVTSTAPATTSIPGGCNPAHPGSCPSSYFSTVTTATATATNAPSSTSIPGGCNPAHPGSCPSSYFSTITTVTATATNAPSSTVTQIVQPSSPASPVKGAGWTIKQLTRYCSPDNSGCDYNFAISTNDGSPDERCTVIRMPGKDAITESFYGIPCTSGSTNSISWGYSDQFGADNAFAVLTVTNNIEKVNAYFGVANVNSKPVTPSNPAGSGNFGDIGPQPLYTF